MIQLADLFHEHRFAEVTFPLILYFPIGLCLLLLRSIGLLLLFLISLLFPGSSSLVTEALSFLLSLSTTDETVRNQTETNQTTAKIIVSNRVTIFDSIVLRQYFSNGRYQWIDLWKNDVVSRWFRLNSTSDSSQTQEELVDLCVNQIEKSNCSLIFLPECETTSGTDGLLKFNLVPFTLAQKQRLTILPVSLRVSRALSIRTNTFNSHPLSDLFWFLFSPSTRYHINCLTPVTVNDSSTDESLCETVRENFSRAMKIESTEFDQRHVLDLQQRPDLFRQRHEQRRLEFQNMIQLVHQQIPQASLEAIRYDLEATKSVEQTINNLKERAEAAARAAAAAKTTTAHFSRAMNKSSNSNNHRHNYERLKQELIEKNRQLFLNKNPS